MTIAPVPCNVAELQTPAPLVDAAILEANLARMAEAWPGERLPFGPVASPMGEFRGMPPMCAPVRRDIEGRLAGPAHGRIEGLRVGGVHGKGRYRFSRSVSSFENWMGMIIWHDDLLYGMGSRENQVPGGSAIRAAPEAGGCRHR